MPEENHLVAPIGEVHMTITIKRKETGVEETHELVCKVMPEQEDAVKELINGNHP